MWLHNNSELTSQALVDRLFRVFDGVKFFSRKDARGNTFIWPTKDDLQTIDEKFIIFNDFEILPSPGLTHWIIPEMDEIYDH